MPTKKEISKQTVNEYYKRAWKHVQYCKKNWACATTLSPSLFQYKCFKTELLKFCQNPEASFNDEAIENEIKAQYNFVPIDDLRQILDEKQEKELVFELQKMEISRLKRAVTTLATLIREEELSDSPRRPEEVFEEIRQSRIII